VIKPFDPMEIRFRTTARWTSSFGARPDTTAQPLALDRRQSPDIGSRAMSHRAAVYTVRIHERRHPTELQPFGNVNEEGIYLPEWLRDNVFTKDFSVEEGDKEIFCEQDSKFDEPDLRVWFRPGQSGQHAEVMEAGGQTLFTQTADHRHILQSGALFRLPRGKTIGYWALHINDGRGSKTLIYDEMWDKFHARFPDLLLKVQPAVDARAFKKAVGDGQITSVHLAATGPSADIKDGDKWVTGNTGMKLDLVIRANKGYLRPNLVKDALQGDNNALGSIVEFGEIEFDRANVEVQLENGDTRHYDVSDLTRGHAMSAVIHPDTESDGAVKPASVFDELRKVLAPMR
jgi:hypothetical protein